MTRGVCRAHFECQLCQVWEASIKDPHHWWGGFEGQSLGYRETRCPPGVFHCTLQSLSGFISPVESVRPDSSEVTIGAGAASGTIKNIEEAKVVRTFTGHRSSCASLDFHPFGEFLATGSSDTNMKIWDTQQKRCIHTYKVIPNELMCLNLLLMADGLFLVWDLTAGKLMHNFCLHEGPVNCLDVHPYEFLLATGSVDTTVKFWDLETFELIGSSGPENNREYFELVRILSLISSNHHISGIFVWKWMTCFL
uniref:Uncharacterized protein n=1 Tax=Zea mays TaxID=4577 RepID=A0A804QT18_MAIZE